MARRFRDLKRLVAELEAQGCKVRKTGDGWFVMFPSGEGGIAIHTSVSDWRGWKNNASRARRAGIVWPEWFKY